MMATVGDMLKAGHGAGFPPGTVKAKPTCPECNAGKIPSTGEQIHFVDCPLWENWVNARWAQRNADLMLGMMACRF